MKWHVCKSITYRLSFALSLLIFTFHSNAFAWTGYKISGSKYLIALQANNVSSDIPFSQSFDNPNEFHRLVSVLTDKDPKNDIEVFAWDFLELEAAATKYCAELEENALRIRSWRDQTGTDVRSSPLAGARVQPKPGGYRLSRAVIDCKAPKSERVAYSIQLSMPFLASCVEFSGQKLVNRHLRLKEEELSEYDSAEARIMERQEIDAQNLAMRIHLLAGLDIMRRNGLAWHLSDQYKQLARDITIERRQKVELAFENLESLDWTDELERLRKNYNEQASKFPDSYPLAAIRSNRAKRVLSELIDDAGPSRLPASN